MIEERIHIAEEEWNRDVFVCLQKEDFKPKGLWYGIGQSWIEWCQSSDNEDWIGPYWYRLEVDLKRILVVKPNELDGFTNEYGVPLLPERDAVARRICNINWPKLAREFDGIEIPVYSWRHRMDLLWYYGWDCASGCIWNPRAILDVTEIRRPDGKRQEEQAGEDGRSRVAGQDQQETGESAVQAPEENGEDRKVSVED